MWFGEEGYATSYLLEADRLEINLFQQAFPSVQSIQLSGHAQRTRTCVGNHTF